jgi:outer membrane protein assembly factor BamE (lipoprotein component of BamABCDE complex)
MRLPRTRISIRQLLVATAVLGVIVAFVRFVFIDNSPDQLLASAILGESTVYAKGYSEHRFRTIKVGMTASQVEAIMGTPLRKGLHPAFGLPDPWFYTYHEDMTANYKRRWVVFNNGKVVNVINDFWVD